VETRKHSGIEIVTAHLIVIWQGSSLAEHWARSRENMGSYRSHGGLLFIMSMPELTPGYFADIAAHRIHGIIRVIKR